MRTQDTRHSLRLRPGAAHCRLLAAASALLALAAVSGCGKKSSSAPEVVAACPDDPGVICTFAGDGVAGYDGDGRAPMQTRFYWPVDLTITSGGDMYVLDWNNHRVRHLTPQNTFETVIGTMFVGDGPNDLIGPVAGTEVDLNHPMHLEESLDGTLLLAAWHNHKLRHYDPASGMVVVTCGAGAGFAGDGGPAANALLNQPPHVLQAADGNIYIMDQRNQRIRRIRTDGVIETAVGTGERDVAGVAFGDGGPPLAARINQPFGSNPQPGGALAMDAQGRLYFSDVLNHRIRRVDFGANLIETVVGTGAAGFSGDGGPGTVAQINNPRDLEVGPDGRLYIADELNSRIRAYDPVTGIITTVAGNGTAGFSGDGGAATAASLNRAAGLEFDAQGRLYIVDTFNNRIRRVRL
jgi:DNA-binding beta-propeller fold protein YncE